MTLLEKLNEIKAQFLMQVLHSNPSGHQAEIDRIRSILDNLEWCIGYAAALEALNDDSRP